MATTHNYAACQVAVCQLCDAYAEIEHQPDRTHSNTCGCRPCVAVRGVVKRVDSGDRRDDRPDRERPHL